MTNRKQNLSLICNGPYENIGTKIVEAVCMEMKNRTILVADDEPDIREILVFNLEQEGYRCLQASNGQEAMQIARTEPVDLALLDIMMPNMSGLEVAEAWQKSENCPAIIFLTALGEEADVLRGFELGADDYILKPFSLKQVLARIAAVIRRRNAADMPVKPEENAIAYEDLRLYDSMKTATLCGSSLSLTRMEYELLAFLLQHPDKVYSRADILQYVWPNDGLVLERTVDVTVNRLRKKIGPYREHLKAKTGYGYYWEK
jgi:DNA-binding response OmpR family regulator